MRTYIQPEREIKMNIVIGIPFKITPSENASGYTYISIHHHVIVYFHLAFPLLDYVHYYSIGKGNIIRMGVIS